MLKLFSVIAVAVLLLLFEFFTWRPEASALIGTVGIQSVASYSDVEKAACDAADELCEKGKTLSCSPGKAGPECECAVCLSEGAAVICPRNPACCASPGTARVCPVIGFCFCPK
jgi:hypothetical protein